MEAKVLNRRTLSRLIFFDIDNTLIDHSLAERIAVQTIFDLYRRSFRATSETEFLLNWRTATDKYIKHFLDGRLSFSEQRLLRFQEVMALSTTMDEAEAVSQDYLRAYEANWKAFDDVETALIRLKEMSMPMGIISNGSTEQQTKKLRSTNLLHFFDCVVISESIGKSKPDPEIFNAACAQMGFKNEECVLVGDSIESDIRGAEATGMGSVWLNREGADLPEGEGGSVNQIRRMGEIPSLLRSGGIRYRDRSDA